MKRRFPTLVWQHSTFSTRKAPCRRAPYSLPEAAAGAAEVAAVAEAAVGADGGASAAEAAAGAAAAAGAPAVCRGAPAVGARSKHIGPPTNAVRGGPGAVVVNLLIFICCCAAHIDPWAAEHLMVPTGSEKRERQSEGCGNRRKRPTPNTSCTAACSPGARTCTLTS